MASNQHAVMLKERIAKLKEYEFFDLDEKQNELDKAKGDRDRAQKRVNTLTAEINDYKLAVGLPVDDATGEISQEELIGKVKEVMARTPNGANGKEIAKAMAMPGVDSNAISALYWTDGQTTLKKTGGGLQTKYYLATPDDLDLINKAKEVEKAAREAAKATNGK